MVVKVKEKFEKTRHVKNNDKSKKYILRGQRNVRYHDRVLSKKRNFIISRHSSVQKGIWHQSQRITRVSSDLTMTKSERTPYTRYIYKLSYFFVVYIFFFFLYYIM